MLRVSDGTQKSNGDGQGVQACDVPSHVMPLLLSIMTLPVPVPVPVMVMLAIMMLMAIALALVMVMCTGCTPV